MVTTTVKSWSGFDPQPRKPVDAAARPDGWSILNSVTRMLRDGIVQNSADLSVKHEMPSSREVLDTRHLSQQTFGDLDLERDILALFREQCKKLVPVISGNFQLSIRIDATHTLKGGARAVGAVAVACVAEEIETALRRHGELSRGQSDALSRCIVEILAAIDARLA